MPRSRVTQPVDQLARKMLGRVDKKGKRHAAAAVEAWADAVGTDIAAHTRGFALRENGELTVYVDSAAWAHQLSLMSMELIEYLNRHLHHEAVTSLRFTVSRKVREGALVKVAEADITGFYALDDIKPMGLDEIEYSQAVKVASVIGDETLREAALRAMVKDLELKKGKRRSTPSPSPDASS
ncbi:MAG: DUF721 domain-containing protein [Coriobacteriia bacterium]